jgi:tRNA (guanine10-N2)-methyltransferase
LKKRLYIGPTSLDPSLAFIMTNMGHVREHSIVFDPFVGTGSILIAASALGSLSIGADIDIRVLNGEMYAGTGDRSVKRHIFESFREYDLPRPELIRLDNHLLDGHVRIHRSNRGLYDAIITDPPYGIRAGAKKTGNSSANSWR